MQILKIKLLPPVTAHGKIGEQHFKRFSGQRKSIPTILTTSQKLSTV